MKKSKLFFLLLFTVIFSAEISWAQTAWEWGIGGRRNYTEAWGGSVTDASGSVYTLTTTYGGDTTFLGPFAEPDSTYTGRLLLVKTDSSGNFTWVVGTANTNGDNWPIGVVADTVGNMYVAGIFSNDTIVTIGPYTLHDPIGSFVYLFKITPGGTVLWAKIVAHGCPNSLGMYDNIGGMGIDGADNVYITDAFGVPTLTIGSTTLVNPRYNSIFVAKYDPSGNPIWAKSFTDNLSCGPYIFTVSKNGKLYMAGLYNDTLVMGSTSLMHSTDFLAMLDSNGNARWALPENYFTRIQGMTTDAAGNLYVTGYLQGPQSIGTFTPPYYGGTFDAYIARYDTTGTVMWANDIGSAQNDQGQGITIDPCGNLWVTGEMGTATPFHFGSTTVSPPGPNYDPLFIAEYTTSGTYISSMTLPGGGDDQSSLAFDRFGNFYLSGDYWYVPLTFAHDTLQPDVDGNEQLFIAKYKYDTINSSGITGPDSVCAGSAITLSDAAPGGVWSSRNGHATVTTGGLVTSVSPGVDTIFYSVVTACASGIAAHIIVIDSTPVAGTISGPSSLCVGAAITLSDPAARGVWSSSNTRATVAAGIVTGVLSGIDTIKYTVTNSCGTAMVSKPVTVNPLANPGVISGSPTVCIGSSIVLTETITGGTWSSSSGSATVVSGTVTGVSIGVAIITYSVTNSCGTAIAVHPVTINLLPSAGTVIGLSALCVGGTITLTDVAPGGTWSRSNAHASVTGGAVTGVSAGADTIRYTVTNSCGTAAASHTITVNPLPYAGIITGAPNVCVGSVMVLTDTAAGGLWSIYNAHAIFSGDTVTGISVGTDTVKYAVSNTCGTAFAIFPFTVNPQPYSGTVTGPLELCVGDTITLTDTTAGGTWSVGNTHAIFASGILKGISAGTDTIFYSVTNLCGTSIATHPVTIDPVPDAGNISGPSTVCAGSTVSLNDTAVNGVWSCSNTSASALSGIVTGVFIGVDTVTYTVTNSCGTALVVKPVTVDPLPYAGIITGPASMCQGDSISLSDTTAGGAWSSSNAAVILSGAVTVKGVSAGTANISYSVTNSCGTATATHAVVIYPLPDTLAIMKVGYLLSVAPGYTSYQWTLNGAPISGATTNTYTYATTGAYSVIVDNSSGCGVTHADIVVSECSISEIEVFPNPSESLVYIRWCNDVTVRINCIDGKLVRIIHNATQVDLSDLPNATYALTLFDKYGRKILTKRISKIAK